jgi:hypothetical protein
MSTGDNIITGVTILGDAATIAAPAISVYNPAVGAALQIFGPLVENFIISETQVIMNLKKDTSKEDMIKLLQSSMSANWGIKPLETPKAAVPLMPGVNVPNVPPADNSGGPAMVGAIPGVTVGEPAKT